MRAFALLVLAGCNGILGIHALDRAGDSADARPGDDAPDARPGDPMIDARAIDAPPIDAMPIDAEPPPPPFTVQRFVPRLVDATWDGTQFLAGGDGGEILSSPDGTSWSPHALPDRASVREIACGGGVCVVASWEPSRSTDGATWQPINGSPSLYKVRYVDGQFVGIDGANTIQTSPDGLSWTPRATAPTGMWFDDVAYGNGQFVIAGIDGRDTSHESGGAWTTSDLSQLGAFHAVGPYMFRVDYGNGMFVGEGWSDLFHSSDGVSWTVEQLPGTVLDVGFFGGQFVLPGAGGKIYRTPSGTIASLVSSQVDVQDRSAIAGDGNRLIAVGDETAVSSDGGATWQVTSSTLATTFHGVAASDGTSGTAAFVAVGSKGRILTSSDGTAWHDTGYTNEPTDLVGVTFGNGEFVAIGGNHTYTSNTGQSWIAHSSTVSLQQIVYGNGIFVGLYGGNVYTSPDGIAWSAPVASLPDVARIDFGGGVFYGSASNATIYTSGDATSWTPHVVPGVPSNTWWSGVAKGDTTLGAVGGGGGQDWLARSTDGVLWTAIEVPRGNGEDLAVSALGWAGDRFLAEGAFDDGMGVAATDLTAVTELGTLPQMSGDPWIHGVAYHPTLGRTVMVGDESLVVSVP